MALVYHEWRPRDALADTVLTFWTVEGEGDSVSSPIILPDAYVEIVINLGDPVMLDGDAFRGPQPPRVVVGLLDRAIHMRYGARVHTFGIRLHAARAATFLGIAAKRLVNRLIPLIDVNPALDTKITEADRSNIEDVLEQQRQSGGRDPLVERAVDRLLVALQPVPIVGIARELGITPRHLRRRFLGTVGTPPKRLERLARFARAWQQATLGPPVTWAELAYANGYADQAHLIREFHAFGADAPGHLFTPEWYEATTIRRVGPRRR